MENSLRVLGYSYASRSTATIRKKKIVWLSLNSFLSKQSNMDSDLDKEYSPSLWSKRFSNGDDVIKSHIEFVDRGLLNVYGFFFSTFVM